MKEKEYETAHLRRHTEAFNPNELLKQIDKDASKKSEHVYFTSEIEKIMGRDNIAGILGQES